MLSLPASKPPVTASKEQRSGEMINSLTTPESQLEKGVVEEEGKSLTLRFSKPSLSTRH